MLRLYSKDNKLCKRCISTADSVIHFYTHEYCNVSIVGVSENTTETPYLYHHGLNRTNSLQSVLFFTLYIPQNNTSVVIKVEDMNNEGYTMLIKRNDGNEVDETNQHYNDLLTNKDLPSYNLIEPAIIPSSNYDKREMIKKLLLDFYQILHNKGTKASVENFFKYLGYEDYTDNKLIINDILSEKGEKTGYYITLYHYWTSIGNGYNEDNLPDFSVDINDIDEFKNAVIHAINVANEYFTTEEQIIKIFNIQYNCNIPIYRPTTTKNYKHGVYDSAYYRHFIKINLYTFDEYQSFRENHISDNIMIDNTIEKHEVKFLMSPVYTTPTTDFCKIQSEIFENEEVSPSDVNKYGNSFGSIIHLDIDIPDTHNTLLDIEYEFKTNDISYKYPRTDFSAAIHQQFLLLKNTTYTLIVKMYDHYGSVETYTYNLDMIHSETRIDFDVFNSAKITPLNTDEITYQELSIEAKLESLSTTQHSITFPTGTLNNYIIPQNLVPVDLGDYFQTSPATQDLQWLNIYDIDKLKTFNIFDKLKDVTDTIPLCVLDNFIEIISFEYEAGDTLMIKIYDPIQQPAYRYVPLTDVSLYNESLDNIIAQAVPVYEQPNPFDTPNPPTFLGNYWILYSVYCGYQIPIDKLAIRRNSMVIPLGSIQYEITQHQLFIDTPIDFHSDVITGTDYCPNTPMYNMIKMNDGTIQRIPSIKSIFPHLTKNNSQSGESYNLKLSDIVFVRLSPRYVNFPMDTHWKVTDTFDNDLILHESDLKNCVFRFNRKNTIDISAVFELHSINGDSDFTKTKKSFQSFKSV